MPVSDSPTVSAWSLIRRTEDVQSAPNSSRGIALSAGVNSLCSWEEAFSISLHHRLGQEP